MSPFLIVRNNKAPFLDWTVMCDEKWILHDNQWQPAQWLDWKEAPNHFPKANFTKKWSWSLVDCCSSDPLQLFESQWNHYIWEVCSAHRWASLQPALTAASTGQQKGPNPSPWQHLTTCHMTNASKVKKKKVERIGLRSLASSSIFTWPLTNWSPLLQASWQRFAGKTLPQLAGGKNVFSRVPQILKHEFLCYKNKQKYSLLAKMYWL